MSVIDPHLACRRAWIRYAARNGHDPALPGQLLRSDGSVMRFGPVVLKHAAEDFGRVVRAHRQAARLLRSDPANRAVPFLGFDDAARVVMVGFVPGPSLAQCAQKGVSPVRLSALVGRWLRAYHDARATDMHRFDAQGPLRRVPDGARYLPRAYAAARDALSRQTEAVHGTRQVLAVLHGDLNASNLIVAGDVVTGLDFGNLRHHPALRDAGQVLAALHLRAARAPHQILPPAWRRTFEGSYGACGPALEFFVRQRLLLHWARVPSRPEALGPAGRHMARNLAALFSD